MAGSTKRDGVSDRYIGLRIRNRQGELFADGSTEKYFAVVTNDFDTNGGELLHWQRQKSGTIEQLHNVLQNGLALGVLPCGRFGANAAWQRLLVLAHNLLRGIQLLTLDKDLRNAHPKRLRFVLFTMAARIVRNGRQTWLRIAPTAERIARLALVRLRLWQLAAVHWPAVATG